MSLAYSLEPSYYEALKRLTLEIAGVKLGDNHEFLVETRLAALARREGFETMPDLVDELFSQGQTRLAVNVVSALLERDMQFYDDGPSFDTLLERIMPSLLSLYKGTPIKILSFGCGTGQEAFSIAMSLDTLKSQFPDFDYHITGVDYPSHSLSRARQACYTHFEVQRGLPARKLVRYFHNKGEDWQVKDRIRDKVTFKDFHLLSNLEPLGTFQLVLFRNSLNRYAGPAQMRILRGLSPIIASHGYLMMGSTETLSGLNFRLDKVEGADGFYKKQEPAPIQVDDGRKKPNGKTSF